MKISSPKDIFSFINQKAMLFRVLLFIFGLFIMAIGVNISVKASLGVSPVSSLPYVYSLFLPLTLGQTTMVLQVLLVIVQVILLKKDYQWIQLIQIPVGLLFGLFIDVTLPMTSWIELSTYLTKAFYCLLSCMIIAFAVLCEVKAKVTYLAGEGVAMAVSSRFGVEFGKAKIGVDSLLVLAGIISALIFIGSVQGIREGTIVAALLVGYFVRVFDKLVPFHRISWLAFDQLSSNDTQITASNVNTAGAIQPHIITISREYGSGGHEIGKLIAQKLGISFYDEELIQLTADQSGFTSDYIKANEQKLAHSLLYSLYEQNYAYVNEQTPPLDALFLVQSKLVRDISVKESCVIVGRCAEFVLKDNPNCLTVFIHGDIEFRKSRIMKRNQIDSVSALKIIESSDHERFNYCRHYTGTKWGGISNYDLAIQSSTLGIELTAEILIQAIEARRLQK